MKKIVLGTAISLALFLSGCSENKQEKQGREAFKQNVEINFDKAKKDLENKFALIIFFSTTCSDCQKAFPDISTLYHTYKDDPSVCVLLIARGETEEQVAAYFREHQYNMKFFADPDLNVYSLFADNTIPRVFLADKDGTIILTQTEKVDAGLLISGGVEPHPYKPEKS